MDIVCRQPTVLEPQKKSAADPHFLPAIVCRNCSHPVTDPTQRINMNGGFYHTFANPHGQVFEIGCFQRAPGCAAASDLSVEFTWFAGYAWQVGICTNCAGHLGWVFTAPGHRFFGLILDRLVFP